MRQLLLEIRKKLIVDTYTFLSSYEYTLGSQKEKIVGKFIDSAKPTTSQNVWPGSKSCAVISHPVVSGIHQSFHWRPSSRFPRGTQS